MEWGSCLWNPGPHRVINSHDFEWLSQLLLSLSNAVLDDILQWTPETPFILANYEIFAASSHKFQNSASSCTHSMIYQEGWNSSKMCIYIHACALSPLFMLSLVVAISPYCANHLGPLPQKVLMEKQVSHWSQFPFSKWTMSTLKTKHSLEFLLSHLGHSDLTRNGKIKIAIGVFTSERNQRTITAVWLASFGSCTFQKQTWCFNKLKSLKWRWSEVYCLSFDGKTFDAETRSLHQLSEKYLLLTSHTCLPRFSFCLFIYWSSK